jgi:hypothetical protein
MTSPKLCPAVKSGERPIFCRTRVSAKLAVPIAGWARRVSYRPFAALFALSGVYVAFNEGFDNWQSLWMCGCFAALAIILWRARGAPVQE